MPDPTSLRSLEIPVPPNDVRYRIVSSHNGEEVFLDSGRRCAVDVLQTLTSAGIDPHSFRNILDFGCGCSRVLRYLIPCLPEASFHGCDIDSVGIDWSTRNVPQVQFAVVPHLPPTTYPRGKFDLIYGLSVFSHLDLPRQILWLEELHQMLRPGGILLLTVHGSAAYDAVKQTLAKKDEDYFAATGFLFLENIADHVLPDWYQTSIYTESFARLIFRQGFSILSYEPQGMCGFQDAVLLRKN